MGRHFGNPLLEQRGWGDDERCLLISLVESLEEMELTATCETFPPVPLSGMTAFLKASDSLRHHLYTSGSSISTAFERLMVGIVIALFFCFLLGDP